MVQKKSTQKTPRLALGAMAIALLASAFGAVTIFVAIASGLVPAKYIALLIGGIALPAIAAVAIVLLFRKKAFALVISIVLALIASGISAAALYSVITSERIISSITNDSSIEKVAVDQNQPFNLYISGIDTYGDITTVSRSDVNIVATINPKTKHILLTTIPRDAYVKIPGAGADQYDKLTHAGNYGVETSMKTVSNLLLTPINTYARINFSSFITTIDQIGGIDVENPVTFRTDSGQVFQQGTLRLNGKDALTFSRERHNLAGGDGDRGQNQQRVITAVFKKLSSQDLLKNYTTILGALGKAVQTNVSSDSLTGLVNQLINDGNTWTIDSIAITGSGPTGQLPSYAMPNSKLYMLVLNTSSLQQAQAAVQDAFSATK
jgi:LCP family protein required for cell wall assembly